jgi:hypothetical protein
VIQQSDAHKDELPEELQLAFAPLHKRAFGIAVGLTAGVGLFVVTVYATLSPGEAPILPLLSYYFPAYEVSFVGAIIGFAWSTFAFFVAGWFCAFVRNFVIAANIWIARTREELRATRDFLDHI